MTKGIKKWLGYKFLLIVALAAVFGILLWGRESSPAPAQSQVYSGEVVISMTREGFVPDKIRIGRGTKVRFKNEDSLWHWPASDIHPTHSIYPEFDPLEPIAPGQEWAFMFERTGTWSMHDHLAPYVIGTITVD